MQTREFSLLALDMEHPKFIQTADGKTLIAVSEIAALSLITLRGNGFLLNDIIAILHTGGKVRLATFTAIDGGQSSDVLPEAQEALDSLTHRVIGAIP